MEGGQEEIMTDTDHKEWHTIQIDDELFRLLQREARPLLDSPNDVLRRLLLSYLMVKTPKTRMSQYFSTGDSAEYPAPIRSTNTRPAPEISSDEFVRHILDERFEGGFQRLGRYKYMFESKTDLVYFQNFNSPHLSPWYRLKKKERDFLVASRKAAWVCLTYPPGRVAFLFPIRAIEERVRAAGYPYDDLEITITHKRNRWPQLDWDIRQYRYDLS
jgi:hypothetical protein